jgi:hypothetical protein
VNKTKASRGDLYRRLSMSSKKIPMQISCLFSLKQRFLLKIINRSKTVVMPRIFLGQDGYNRKVPLAGRHGVPPGCDGHLMKERYDESVVFGLVGGGW